jgi:hypothetical protein
MVAFRKVAVLLRGWWIVAQPQVWSFTRFERPDGVSMVALRTFPVLVFAWIRSQTRRSTSISWEQRTAQC